MARLPSLQASLAFLLLQVLLLASPLHAATAAGLAEEGEGVAAVGLSSFDAAVADKAAWVLLFHSPRCGSCQEFDPIWQAAARNLRTLARFGHVDIDTDDGFALARELDIFSEGVPNVKVFGRLGSAAPSASVWRFGDDDDDSINDVEPLSPSVEEIEARIVHALGGRRGDDSALRLVYKS
eukprot:jgi/Chlat1/7351/Chrsp59S06973